MEKLRQHSSFEQLEISLANLGTPKDGDATKIEKALEIAREMKAVLIDSVKEGFKGALYHEQRANRLHNLMLHRFGIDEFSGLVEELNNDQK
jgi:hypothetical protein